MSIVWTLLTLKVILFGIPLSGLACTIIWSQAVLPRTKREREPARD